MTEDSLELNRYFPFYMVTISNRWTASSSRYYLANFGIGIGEWRVLASAYSLGDTNSNSIANFVLMDAAAVSRSLVKLEEKNLIEFKSNSSRSRTKNLSITDAGRELYLEMRKSAYERQDQLLKSLSESEKENLLLILKKIANNLVDFE